MVTTVPSLGPITGLIAGVGIGLWENHAPADKIVKANLWLLAAFGTGIVGAVATSYSYFRRAHLPLDWPGSCDCDIARSLPCLRRTRPMMQPSSNDGRQLSLCHESRQRDTGGMLELHGQIAGRNLPSGSLPVAVQLHIINLAELMDNSAAFGLQAECPDVDLQSRCEVIAQQCAYLARELVANPEILSRDGDSVPRTHLERVERSLSSLSSMSPDAGKVRKFEALPSKHVPLLIPGTIPAILRMCVLR